MFNGYVEYQKVFMVMTGDGSSAFHVAEEWSDLGARMNTLIRLAFGAMDLESWH